MHPSLSVGCMQNMQTNACKICLYNYELHMDTSILQETQSSIVGEDSPPVLKEEVEANVQSLKAGKSPGVDNVTSELKSGGKAVTKVLTTFCQVWKEKKCPRERTQSLVMP